MKRKFTRQTGVAAFLLLATFLMAVPAGAQGLQEGDRAPEFTAENLTGDPVALRDQAGNLVFISFFAEWCKPCRAEAPILNRLAATYKETLRVLAIGYQETDPAVLRRVSVDFGLAVPVLVDSKETLARGYSVTNLPRGILIDEYGYVTKIYAGMSEHLAEGLEEIIRQHSREILARRARGMSLYVSDFENVDERGKQNGTGAKVAERVRKGLGESGVKLAGKPEEATLLLTGTVSDLGPIVGVEIVLKEPGGRELSRERASIVDGKDQPLLDAASKAVEAWK